MNGGRTLAAATIAMVGGVYGSLTVVDLTKGPRGETMFRCKCKCGRHTLASPWALRNGHRTSCGCMQGGDRYGDGWREARAKRHAGGGRSK